MTSYRLVVGGLALGVALGVAAQPLLSSSDAYADVVHYGAGTYLLSRPLVVADRTALVGAGSGQTIFKAAPGYTGALITTSGSTDPLHGVHHPGIRIQGITVDGGGTASRGIYLLSADGLRLVDVEAMRTTGNAIEARGTMGTALTEDQSWQDVRAHDCGGWGVYNGLRTRRVSYVDIKVDACAGGMTIDHSESSANGLQLTGNRGNGLWLRNVFGLTVSGVRATGNGGWGVHVQGFVDSVGSTWLAENNKGGDVWFDASAPPPEFTYGVTRGSVVTSLLAGHSPYVLVNQDVTEQTLRIDRGVNVRLDGLDITTGRAVVS